MRASRTAVVIHALQKTRVVRGKCYVTKDASTPFVQPLFLAALPFAELTFERLMQNIDTDQIIPAEYLTLVPSKVLQLSVLCTSAVDEASTSFVHLAAER